MSKIVVIALILGIVMLSAFAAITSPPSSSASMPHPTKTPIVVNPAVQNYGPVGAQMGGSYNFLHFSGSGYQPGDNR